MIIINRGITSIIGGDKSTIGITIGNVVFIKVLLPINIISSMAIITIKGVRTTTSIPPIIVILSINFKAKSIH